MSATQSLMQQFYDMLLESQFWPRQQLIDYQRSQLEQLLRHARANVPFYENRLDPVFARDGSVDWDKWEQIPIVKRSDLVEHRGAMQARVLPPGHSIAGTIATSGSTGTPISVTTTGLSVLASNTARWRWDHSNGIDWSKKLYIRQDAPTAVWPQGLKGGPWGPPWDASSKHGATFILNREATPAQQVDFIRRVAADYLAAGPKPAHAIALEAERQHVELKLSGVMASGEATTAEDRQAFERVFGAKAYELYSSKEGSHMAYRCSHSAVWHVNAELLLLEVVDDHGLPCKPGETGRVVITPFFSTAQPLVRYDQGDLAVAGTGCTCGRTLPTVERFTGRTTHMFRHPDGRRIQRAFPDQYRALLGCSTWQIAQIGPTNFEFRYVPLDWQAPAGEAEVAEAFREWYFADATLRFSRLHDIPATSGGKVMEYVYEVTAP